MRLIDENDFTIVRSLPIEGNEDVIQDLFDGERNKIHEIAGSISDGIRQFESAKTRTGRFIPNAKRRRGTNGRMDGLDVQKSSNRRNDYAEAEGVTIEHTEAEYDAMEEAVKYGRSVQLEFIRK